MKRRRNDTALKGSREGWGVKGTEAREERVRGRWREERDGERGREADFFER